MNNMKKFFLISTTLLLFFVDAFAGDSEFFYFFNAKSTGNGKVYASKSDTFNPSSASTEFHSDKQTMTLPGINNQDDAFQYIHLSAVPDEGYGFKQWRKVESFGGNTLSTITTRKAKVNEKLKKDQTYNFYYEADFASTMLSVGTANGTYVQAFIDKEINKIGDKVILTASTQGNYKIVWKKKVGNTITEVSRSNPLLVEVTEKAHYIADVDDEGEKLAAGYYRIRTANPTPDFVNRYLMLTDNWFDMTSIVGSARNAIVNVPSITVNAQNVLKRDLNLTTDYVTNPSTIIYLQNTSQSNTNYEYNFFAQGVDVKQLTTGTHHGSSTISYEGCYVSVMQAGDVYEMFPHIAMTYLGVTIDFGNYYFNNYYNSSNGNYTFSAVTSDDSYNTKWILERIDNENYYFAPDLSKAIYANNKYYTTLRLPFPCKIIGTDLKAYSVTAYPTSTGDLATKTEYSAGNTIPAGLPVIIESMSNNPANNILEPVEDPIQYTSYKATSSTGETTGINTPLYNKYGTHAHDSHSDQPTNGDGVGYLTVKYSGAQDIYKLSSKDGVVGFWTKVNSNELISGNEAYATQPCALFPKEVLLKDLPETFDQITYKVTNPLTVAYVDAENNTIYAKDEDGTVTQSASGDEIDFMAVHYPDGNYGNGNYSNWVGIKVTSVPTSVVKGAKLKNVTGKIVDTNNPTIQCKTVEVDGSGSFTPKTYSIANFSGSPQYSTPNNHPFFFATPKANEICDIVWAEYDDDGTSKTFNVPVTDAGLSGSVNADFSLYPQTPQTSTVYKFLGLVLKTPSSKAATTGYTVYPLEKMTNMGDTSVPTGISNVNTGNVVNVKYYNVMGVESSVPFKGVNIVVTTYDNGTHSTSKVIR